MRKLITWITSKLKDIVGEENWGDPVWSKVISVGILGVISLVFSAVLAGGSLLLIFFYSLISKVPLKVIIDNIFVFLGEKTDLPNWIIVLFLIFLVSWAINFIYKKRQKAWLNKQAILKFGNEISSKFLVGRWVNQWTNGGRIGTEEVEISDDMKYYKDGMYSFDIIEFEYSKKSNKIFFIKLSNRSMDFGKRFKNTLYILNNNLINGLEDGYEIKYKRFYVPKKVDFDFLVGHWKNQWTDAKGTDFEICKITADKEYYTRDKHFFTLKNFNYDPSSSTITFFKVPAQIDDLREKTFVSLTIKDNDTLVGKEENSDVIYTREF